MTVTTAVAFTPVMTKLAALAECLCDQINASGLPTPCLCSVIPGAALPLDVGTCDDGNGIAYVRLVATYPSVSVGVADITPGNCDKGLGFDIELGLFRCFPMEAEPSAAEVLLEAAVLQMADLDAMRRALNCCDWLPSKDFVVGQYQPFGPDGGVVGGFMPLSAWIP